MADVSVPSIAVVVPSSSDTVAGVQGGLVKRFTIADLPVTNLNAITPTGGTLSITGVVQTTSTIRGTAMLAQSPDTLMNAELSSQNGYFGLAESGVAYRLVVMKTSGRVLVGKTSDDGVGVLQVNGPITIGNTVNSVSPTSPNRTITMVVGGTTYYIPAKTTND